MQFEERLARIRAFLEEKADSCDEELLHCIKELLKICQELYTQASIDFLTGLYNRRFFDRELELAVERAKRERLVFSLILMDIDHFKIINDRYGHVMGDEVLKRLGALIKNTFRKIDIPARYGGEEFAIILPGTGFEGALSAARRFQKRLSQEEFGPSENPFKVTVSMGVGTYRPLSKLSAQEFLKEVDYFLYRAKEAGRNQIFPSSPEDKLAPEPEGISLEERQALKGVWLHDD